MAPQAESTHEKFTTGRADARENLGTRDGATANPAVLPLKRVQYAMCPDYKPWPEMLNTGLTLDLLQAISWVLRGSSTQPSSSPLRPPFSIYQQYIHPRSKHSVSAAGPSGIMYLAGTLASHLCL